MGDAPGPEVGVAVVVRKRNHPRPVKAARAVEPRTPEPCTFGSSCFCLGCIARKGFYAEARKWNDRGPALLGIGKVDGELQPGAREEGAVDMDPQKKAVNTVPHKCHVW